MNIKRKLEIVHNAIRSVSEHTDEDADIVKAALDSIVSFCNSEKAEIDKDIQARIAETLQ